MLALARRRLFNLINGIRSGIPLCCVLFYTRRNTNANSLVALDTRIARGGSINASENDPNYVLCDKCYNCGKIVNIKPNGTIFTGLISDK